MNINDYSYDLPEELIAQHPPKIRGDSRLLVLNKESGKIIHETYPDIEHELNPGDLVILNNTRVIKARLLATNLAGKEREFLLLERHEHTLDTHHWKVLYRRKIHQGEVYNIGNARVKIEAVYNNGIALISSDSNLSEVSEQYGSVPLPPYMKRQASHEDIKRYQTEFAKESGSVAAPTASLNFTNELKERLERKGVQIAYLTLHVGLGTFLPIRSDKLTDHVMHSEYYEVPAETVRLIQEAKQTGHRVVAIGTTVTRTLEYAHKEITEGPATMLSGEADIFIYPGYNFKIVDALLTNFHAPSTTVLMLTAAFTGWDKLKTAYMAAVDERYSFFSYGDSMFIH